MAEETIRSRRFGRNDLTAEYVTSIIRYDPETGGIVRLWKSPSKYLKHKPVGSTSGGRRYLSICIDYKLYQAHRLAWLIMTGEWPHNDIDHINGDGLDNRWENIREATPTENLQNSRLRPTNVSGFKGVTYDKRRGTWFARIHVKGKAIHLGTFRSPQDAHLAYQEASGKQFGQFARFR